MRCTCDWTISPNTEVDRETDPQCLVHGDDAHDQANEMMTGFTTVLDELDDELYGVLHETDGSNITAMRKLCDDLIQIAHVRQLVKEIVDPR